MVGVSCLSLLFEVVLLGAGESRIVFAFEWERISSFSTLSNAPLVWMVSFIPDECSTCMILVVWSTISGEAGIWYPQTA